MYLRICVVDVGCFGLTSRVWPYLVPACFLCWYVFNHEGVAGAGLDAAHPRQAKDRRKSWRSQAWVDYVARSASRSVDAKFG